MSNNPIKDNSQLKNSERAGKRSVWVSFIIFMLWVGIIGLLISLVAYTQSNSQTIATDIANSIVREDE